MAITKTIEHPTKRDERTDEVVIFAPLGKGYQVRVLRVTRDYFANSPPVEVSRRWLQRTMAQLMADSGALPMIAALPPIFDRWAQEDDASKVVRDAASAALLASQSVYAAASILASTKSAARNAAQIVLANAQQWPDDTAGLALAQSQYAAATAAALVADADALAKAGAVTAATAAVAAAAGT